MGKVVDMESLLEEFWKFDAEEVDEDHDGVPCYDDAEDGVLSGEDSLDG